jgi:hypothetical protein
VWPWLTPSATTSASLNKHAVIPFIKRIVGLPGDTLVTSLRELDDIHRARALGAHDPSGNRTWHIPQGYLFVRGDQPVGGWDSLSWGPIPFRSVLGIVIMKLPYRAEDLLSSTAMDKSVTEQPRENY